MLGRTAAATSSTSTRAVSFDTDTKVTSETETRRHRQAEEAKREKDDKKKKQNPDRSGPSSWERPPTCPAFLLQVLNYKFDRVVFHVGGDDVRKAFASVVVSVAALCGSAASPEVLHGGVENQIIGLEGEQRAVKPGSILGSASSLLLRALLPLFHLT